LKRPVVLFAALTLAACSDSGTAPTTNVLSVREKSAVQQALALSFGNDSLYTTLSGFVLPFLDQATPLANANGDTTKLAGFQLQVVAGTITAGVSGVLAWRGYRPATETVDTIFLVVGAGLDTPLSDSLSQTFAVNLLGSGTAWVIAESADSSTQTWVARTGAISVNEASYGSATSADLGGGFSIARARGWMSGHTHLMAKLVPDSSTTVTAALDFSGKIEGVKLTVTGTSP
jgi:hypothetical protein